MTNIARSDEQVAEFVIQNNPLMVRASVRVTPTGLVAIAGLVSTILLSTCAIVWVAGSVHRRDHTSIF
ncbi:hypothetical protein [Asticcacaulis taihuensis]|uniref:hypothetical protein n=1 Tax=Asticcacaulis taihuensis TaxID=260084 RepID=UPI0026EDBD39|nr:hypothetical protein [Asticcacaulis taihuensis]